MIPPGAVAVPTVIRGAELHRFQLSATHIVCLALLSLRPEQASVPHSLELQAMSTPLTNPGRNPEYLRPSPVRGQLEPQDPTTPLGWRYIQTTDTPDEFKVRQMSFNPWLY